MITALRKRFRPDNLSNQVRAQPRAMGRRVYLFAVMCGAGYLLLQLVGAMLFLKADGLVMKDRTVIASLYNARVGIVHVTSGDAVTKGEPLLTLQSTEMLDRLADVIGKKGTIITREGQILSRLHLINAMLPAAVARRQRTMYTASVVTKLASRQLTTQPRQAEVARDSYDAEREEQQLLAEQTALHHELVSLQSSREEMEALSQGLKSAYNEGRILAPATGTIGARVPHVGQVIKAAESALEVYRGQSYVLAYVPTNRLYQVNVGERVVVSEGSNRYHGRIERVETLTDAIPPEFQSIFQTVERQQVVRIVFEQEPPFPLQAKVRITSSYSPTDLSALFKAMMGGIGDVFFGSPARS
jgi:multidrug resistance efflux pump